MQFIKSKWFLLTPIFLLLTAGIWSLFQDSSPTGRNIVEVPPPTLDCNINIPDSLLHLDVNTGMVYHNSQPFTGYSLTFYMNGHLKERTHYLEGYRYGSRQFWYEDGTLSFQANYIDNKLNGIAKTWYPNGQVRSVFKYVLGIPHGTQKQWYKSGALFKEMQLENGQEKGLQQAWRENGKLYANYEAINGRIFGLKKANLCYQLEEENLVKR